MRPIHRLRLRQLLLPIAAVAALVLAAPAAAQAATLYVAPGGDDTANDCTDELAPCATIQHGVDEADPGDTVEVASGTYAESVSIDKDLILNGAQSGVDARDRSASESEVVGSIHATPAASEVTVDGFRVEVTVPSPFSNTGIVADAASSTVLNNIVEGVDTTGPFNRAGIVDFEGVEEVEARGNDIAPFLFLPSSQNGLRIGLASGATTVEVAENRVRDAAGGGIGVNGGGPNAEIAIHDNELIDNQEGMWTFGSTFDSFTIEDNLFRDGLEIGLHVAGGVNGVLAVQGNEFEGNPLQIQAEGSPSAVDFDDALAANTFDRSVVVRENPVKVPTVFSSIEDGVDAADPGDVVDIGAGTYTFSSTMSVDKALTLRGPNHANDPTGGGNRDPEAVIEADDASASPPVPRRTIRVRAAGVTIEGLRFADNNTAIWQNGADEVDGLEIANNVFDGNAEAFGTSQAAPTQPNELNDFGFESNLVTDNSSRAVSSYTGINGSGLTISGNEFVGAAVPIHLGFVDGASITDNTIEMTGDFYGILLADDIANIEIAGNALDGGGVAFPGIWTWPTTNVLGPIEIERNEIRDFDGYGIDIREETGEVTDATQFTLRGNRIVGNEDGGVRNGGTGTLDAEGNWWGCNAGPGASGCDAIDGDVDADPWLVLGLTAGPTSILIEGGTSQVIATLALDSDGQAGTPVPDGTPVAFDTDLGSVAPGSGAFANGLAFTTLTAEDTPGVATVTATVDSEQVGVEVELEPLPAPELDLTGRPPIRNVGPNRQRISYRFLVENVGNEETGPVRFCAAAPPRRALVVGPRCVERQSLVPGQVRERRVTVRIRPAARGTQSLVRLIATGPEVENKRTTVRLRVRD